MNTDSPVLLTEPGREIEDRPLQPENAHSPIIVTEYERTTEINLEQPENKKLPISATELPRTTRSKLVQPAKVEFPRERRPSGSLKSVKQEHPENAESSMELTESEIMIELRRVQS